MTYRVERMPAAAALLAVAGARCTALTAGWNNAVMHDKVINCVIVQMAVQLIWQCYMNNLPVMQRQRGNGARRMPRIIVLCRGRVHCMRRIVRRVAGRR